MFSSKSSGLRHFGSFRHVAKSLRHAKTRCPITQTARLERVKEFSSVAVRARHITTAPTARSTCRCLDTECCARSVRIARTVADSGPSVTSTRSTSHRTGLPSARNKFTMSTFRPRRRGRGCGLCSIRLNTMPTSTCRRINALCMAAIGASAGRYIPSAAWNRPCSRALHSSSGI